MHELKRQFIKQLATPLISEKLFEQVPDIVYCIKDENLCYIAANRAFAERIGVKSTNEIIGKKACDLFPDYLANIYQAQDKIVLEKGEEITDRLELISQYSKGIGWYLASKFPLRGVNGKVIGIASISRDLQTPCENDLKFAGLLKIVEKIQKHYMEEMIVSDLAASINLSVPQLDRRMKKIFKLSTSHFIRKTRLEVAARLLTQQSTAISEVAQRSGYSDQSAFTRQFKSTVGMTPGAYRDLHTKNK